MWTGGFDSTLRIVQLSEKDIIIEPYYIYFPQRKSVEKELETIEKLRKMILERPSTKAEIKHLHVMPSSDFLPVDKDILEAYEVLYKTDGLAKQNKVLAMATRKIPGLEICFERSKGSKKIVDTIIEKPYLTQLKEQDEIYYYINENAPKEVYTIFKDYKFPKRIIELTKQEEYEDFKRLNALDIAKATWFCQFPINDEPCGYCSVCRASVQELGDWRLTEAGKKRYKHWRFHLAVHKVKRLINVVLGKDKIVN